MLLLELRVAADCRPPWLTTVDGVAADLKGDNPIGWLRDGWKVKVSAARCGQGCKVSAAPPPPQLQPEHPTVCSGYSSLVTPAALMQKPTLEMRFLFCLHQGHWLFIRVSSSLSQDF